MSIIYIVLPLALLIAAAAVGAFIWAARSGQFDDLDTPGLRVLFDDDEESSKVEAARPREDASPRHPGH